MPHTLSPSIGVGRVAQRPATDLAFHHSQLAGGQERRERRLEDRCDLRRLGAEPRPAIRDGDDRGDRVVADRDPLDGEHPEDPHAGLVDVERDLLASLAQRRGDEVLVLLLRPTARERHLARVVPAAVDALGEHEPCDAVLVGKHEDEDRRGPRRRIGLAPGGPWPRLAAVGEHGDQRRRARGQDVRQRLEPPDGLLEAHRPPAS